MGFLDRIAAVFKSSPTDLDGPLSPPAPPLRKPGFLGLNEHHPLALCTRSLRFHSPELAANLSGWVTKGTHGEALANLPKPLTLALLGNGGYRFSFNHALDKAQSKAAEDSVAARKAGYANMPRDDFAPVVRLGRLLEAAWDPANLVRPAGNALPDWMYALLNDMLSHWGPSTYTKELAEISKRTKDLPFLDAAFLRCLFEAGGVDPLLMIRLVLERREEAYAANYDMLLCLPGMGQWLKEQQEILPIVLQELDTPGRRNAAAMIGHWKLQGSFAGVLVRLAVDSAKGVRTEASRLLPEVPEALRVPELERILKEGASAEKDLAADLLGRFPAQRSQAILEEVLATASTPRHRLALETALGMLESTRNAGSAPAIELPAWKPYTVPELGEEVRVVLSERRATVVQERQRTVAKQRAEGEVHSWSLGQLEIASKWNVDRMFGFLAGIRDAPPKTFADNAIVELIRLEKRIVARPDFGLHRVLALCRHHDVSRFWDLDFFQEWLQAQDPATVDLRAVEKALSDLGFSSDSVITACCGSSWYSDSQGCPQHVLPAECVWPFFAERPALLRDLLAKVAARDGAFGEHQYENILRIAETFPVLPPGIVAPLLDIALGTAKSNRRLAQDILVKLPDIFERVAMALEHPAQETRILAYAWIVRLDAARALPLLEKRLAKEARESPRAALLSAIEDAGGDIASWLSPEVLAKEAAKGLKSGPPKALEWFPFAALPPCRFRDGTPVERLLLEWWVVLAHKLKQPAANPLLLRYLGLLDEPSGRELGLFVLRSFVAQDTRGPSLEEANAKAEKEAPGRLATWQSYAKQSWGESFKSKTLQDACDEIRREHMGNYYGSAIGEKGILALSATAPGAQAVETVRRLMKDHNTRRFQIEAILEALSMGEDPLVIQLILSVARRYKTPSVQEKARALCDAIAERRSWSTDDLADRTIPSAELDENGRLELDFGPRRFVVHLDADFKPVIETAEGKVLKSLPDPNQGDDPEGARLAKAQFQALKKGVKQVLDLQVSRLYEALCSGRTWAFQDWQEFLQTHPVVGPLVQRLVWQDEAGTGFRPCEDRSLLDAAGDPAQVRGRVRLAHGTALSEEERNAWKEHLGDFKVKPLFGQLDRLLPVFDPKAERLEDRQGWMSDTFTLRGAFNKRGYQRSEALDGGYFDHYRKDFLQCKVRVVMEFTGNCLPEENVPAALKSLSFEPLGRRSGTLALAQVPAALLAEVYGDYLDIAALCRGFDPQWEKNTPW